ncbi:replication initiation factor domain-containing protein, partial [Streptococcus agalactiae]
MELKVSFDGISITAYIKQSRLFEVKFLIENHVAISVQTAMTDMFKAVTINEGKVILKLDYDKQKGRSFNARPFRMEFNPNKLRQIDNYIIDSIIPCLEDITISRADLAFDLFEVDCSEFVLEKKGRGVATREYRSDIGKLETKYLGASSSEKQIRLYNKKKERQEKGTEQDKVYAKKFKQWWRLEFQLRSRSVDQVFEMLDTIIFKPYCFNDLTVEEQVYISIMIHDKNIWSKVHRNTKRKYKKIVANHKTSETDYL